ncbi:MAG: hypothetical protein LC647_09515 [Beggiatoa sp.]|nr:hypothetical protein [Beggiatoa sp.]
MLRLFARRALITPETAAERRRWEHGDSSSLDAAVRIKATDRKGLERLVTLIPPPRRHRHRYHWAWPHRFAGSKTGQR